MLVVLAMLVMLVNVRIVTGDEKAPRATGVAAKLWLAVNNEPVHIIIIMIIINHHRIHNHDDNHHHHGDNRHIHHHDHDQKINAPV